MLQRLKILHVLRAPVGGLFRHVRDLASEQSARGHVVGLLVDSASSDSLTDQRLAELKPHLALGIARTPMSRAPGLSDLKAILATRRLARELDIDIVHGHGAKGGTYARLAAASLRVLGRRYPRSFYTPHGGSLHFKPGTLAGFGVVAAERLMGPLTDGLIFECQFAQRAYESRIGRSTVGARIIPNGLLDSDFGSHQPSEDAADFLFIGELRSLKGIDLMLHALARGPGHTRAVIVGDGPEASQFKTLANELGLSERVSFTGALPARTAFGLARVLVMPSRAESFPYVVLESAAIGMPLIATDVGGISEIVSGSDTELVESENVAALSEAMASAIDGLDAARARGRRLRTAVKSRFTVDTMTSSVLSFYAEELAEPVAPAGARLPQQG